MFLAYKKLLNRKVTEQNNKTWHTNWLTKTHFQQVNNNSLHLSN